MGTLVLSDAHFLEQTNVSGSLVGKERKLGVCMRRVEGIF